MRIPTNTQSTDSVVLSQRVKTHPKTFIKISVRRLVHLLLTNMTGLHFNVTLLQCPTFWQQFCQRKERKDVFCISFLSFFVRMEPRASSLKVKTQWHVSFHGTRKECVQPILECGDLLMPGTQLVEREQSYYSDRVTLH